jgi:FkbM family methyltransferase
MVVCVVTSTRATAVSTGTCAQFAGLRRRAVWSGDFDAGLGQPMTTQIARSRYEELRATAKRHSWLRRIRPQSLASSLNRFVGAPDGRRQVVEIDGVRLYLDPLTHLGSCLLSDGYEPGLVEIIRRELRRGSTFLDIGANEGFYSALAASVVGPTGRVIAIEPQSRLQDLIEINILLNGRCECAVLPCAIGSTDNERRAMSLTPILQTGSTSLVQRYRWSKKTQEVRMRTLDSLLDELQVRQIDCMKVDVEGFEIEVIKSARKALKAGLIKFITLDYHSSLLRQMNADPSEADLILRDAGYVHEGDGKLSELVLYRHAGS